MVRLLVRAVAIAAVLLTLGGAGWYEGIEAYRSGDYATAMREFRTLADQGDADAQSTVALMYEKGRGVPPDYVRAHMWYNLAASKLAPGRKRDSVVRNRDVIAKRMTPADISRAQLLAQEWRAKHPGEKN